MLYSKLLNLSVGHDSQDLASQAIKVDWSQQKLPVMSYQNEEKIKKIRELEDYQRKNAGYDYEPPKYDPKLNTIKIEYLVDKDGDYETAMKFICGICK